MFGKVNKQSIASSLLTINITKYRFPGFKLPMWTAREEFSDAVEGHWIIFNKNVFAFLVIYQGHPQLTVYHRAVYPGLE